MSITIFSLPRPFVGEFDVVQYNAITSWRLGQPDSEIILFGNEIGTHQMTHKVNARQHPDIRVNEFGTPYINEIFARAQEVSRFNVLCYVNSDIIFLGDIKSTIQRVQTKFKQFVLVTRRYDLKLQKKQDFSGNWQEMIETKLVQRGKKHQPGAIDSFIFTKGVYPANDFPPFLLGRQLWDGWLVWKAMKKNIPVVEITSAVTLIHQHHTRTEDSLDLNRLTQEKFTNRNLFKGKKRSIVQVPWILTHEGLKKNNNR